jgi:hypothetical protein
MQSLHHGPRIEIRYPPDLGAVLLRLRDRLLMNTSRSERLLALLPWLVPKEDLKGVAIPSITGRGSPRAEVRHALPTMDHGFTTPAIMAFSARAWAGLTWAISVTRWEQLADLLVRTTGRLFSILAAHGAPAIEGPYREASRPWP